MKIRIYTDGGALNNPGPAAIGVVLYLSAAKKEYSEFIGEATNNEAEYQALIFALKKVKQVLGKKEAKNLTIDCYSDSELMIKQLCGQYRILEKELQPLFIKVWNLKTEFRNVNFNYVRREENREADKLVKNELSGLNQGLF